VRTVTRRSPGFGKTIPEEARRHMARGQTAVEMAASIEEMEPGYIVPAASGTIAIAGSASMKVTGPVLKYVTTYNICGESVFDNNHGKWLDYCFRREENEIRVVSRTEVRTSKNGGNAPGVKTCVFRKQ
jgi:hypothetical protein